MAPPRRHVDGDEHDHHDDGADLVQTRSSGRIRTGLDRSRRARRPRGCVMRGETAPTARVDRDQPEERPRRRAIHTAASMIASVRLGRRPCRRTVASVPWSSCSLLTEAVDEMGVDAVGIEPAGHEVAGAHPGAAGPVPEARPGCPGAPDAAGSIFTRSSASLTPRGLSGWASAKACSSAVGDVAVHHRHAVLRATPPYFAAYWSRNVLADRVALVVLVDARSIP